MKFQFRGRTVDGREIVGTRQAPDRYALARVMRTEGVILVSAETLQKGLRRWRLSTLWDGLLHHVSLKDKIVFAGSLGAMLQAGLSLSRSLAVLERQTENRRFRKVIDGLSEQINAGSSFSQALAADPSVFPPVFVAMVAAGEEAGKLPQSLLTFRDQLNRSYVLRRKVRGAMIYPAIIIAAMIVVGVLMMIYLVPTLTRLFLELNVELPWTTRVVIAVSSFLAEHTILFVLGVTILSVTAVRFSRSGPGRRWLAVFYLRLPIISPITKNLNAAITMRTMSSLIVSGVSMIEALTITEKVLQNPRYQAAMREGVKLVERGGALSGLFHDHEELYPLLVGELAEVGEETGNLSGMLDNGANFFEEEVDQAVKNLSTLIEPAIMILVGLAVGFFAVSLIGPMYSLTSSLQF